MEKFEPFQITHWTGLLAVIIMGYLTIKRGLSYSNAESRSRFGLMVASIPIVFYISRDLYTAYLGIYDYKIDLPLHLCRMSALLLPLMHYTRNRLIFGVLYFWTFVGAGNALATPDLVIDFPSVEYFVYFIGHSYLIVGVFYAIFVYKMTPGWKDFRNAVIGTNIYVLLSMGFNSILGSNYFYTLGKPDVPSLLDYLGPWPMYLITGQLLMFGLFFIVLTPFLYLQKR